MNKTIKIALLATGDELTQGSILNTNAQEIAHELFAEGFEPNWQMAVPDDVSAIESALNFLFQEHSIVITIGGLGPTSDDKTRFALAAFVQSFLVEHKPSLEKLQKLYQKVNIPFTEMSRQQALFPDQAEILENSVGSANGCMCRSKKNKNKMVFMLPGPPRECLPMFREQVMPRLRTLMKQKKTLLQWKVFGIAEGMVAEKVDNTLKSHQLMCRSGFRWDYPYVDCKVLLDTQEKIKQQKIVDLLNPILEPYQLEKNNQKATERLKHVLSERTKPVFIDDRATGGVLETLIRSHANYGKVIFDHSKKRPAEADFFHIEGLDNYWKGEDGQEAVLTLTSSKDKEKFTIPLRPVLLEIYAAEFLAHQILKKLEQKN